MNDGEDVDTDLADLGDVSFAELADAAALEPHRQVLRHQVERPRTNLGTGPPGRAD